MDNNKRLVIRISSDTMSFSTVIGSDVIYEPYAVNSSISMAANLREALRSVPMLNDSYMRVQVMVDAPVLMVPASLFREEEQELLYEHTISGGHDQQTVTHTVLPDLNAVAIFAYPKDLHTALSNVFADVRYMSAIAPVWRNLHHHSYTGKRQKLYHLYRQHPQRCPLLSAGRLEAAGNGGGA